MKIIYLFICVQFLFCQGFTEQIDQNRYRIEFKTSELRSHFFAIPNVEHKIVSTHLIDVEKVFVKKSNQFYEINNVKPGANIVFEFNTSIANYIRNNDPLSLNRLFSDTQKSKKKSIYKKTYLNSENSIKIYTNREGVYKLSYQYFKTNNIDIENYNGKYVKLYNKGREIPVFIETGLNGQIDTDGDYLLFYSDKNYNTEKDLYPDVYLDPYDYRNVYWLTYSLDDESAGKRLFKKNGATLEQNQLKIFSPRYFNQSVHLEENKYLAQQAIPNVEENIRNRGFYHQRDFIFWNSSISEGIFKSFNIDILNDIYKEIGDQVEFSVMMSGAASNFNGNHRVEFKVSSATYQTPSTLNWTASHFQKIDFNIPINLLKENNTFEVKTLTSTDQTLLNSIDIKFKSQFKSRNNVLSFTAITPDEFAEYTVYKYQVNGFTNSEINVLKKNEAIITNSSITKINDEYSIIFQDEIENQNAEFYAYTNNMILTPEKISINNILFADKDLKSYETDAEMLIITTKLFEASAKDYAQYKKNQGIPTEVVIADVIYNEFNNGNQSPVAIRNFLKYAYENWSDDNRLKYVLFIGDAKKDYYQGNKLDNVIPTFQYISYNKGFTASDSYYGYLYHSKEDYIDFNNNPISDLYVGRIPAETVPEFISYFNKVKEYDSNAPEIQNLFLSGNDYSNTSSNREFSSADRVFLSQLSRINLATVAESNNTILRRAADDPGSSKWILQESTQLLNIFNQGINYMAFMGHGAGAVWGDRNIMVQEDALRLSNKGRYPIVLSMTCYVGAFDGPGRTLGEVLLLQPNLGVVGLLSSSGVSVIYNQYMLGYFLNEELFKNDIGYGEIISLGKYKYFSKGSNYILDTDVVNTPEHFIHKYLLLMEFNYIGDPSLKIKQPNVANLNSNTDHIAPNIPIEFSIDSIEHGFYTNLHYELQNYYGETLVEKDSVNINLNSQLTFSISTGQLTGNDIFYVKGYIKGDSRIYNFGKKLTSQNTINGQFYGVNTVSLNREQLLTNNQYKLEFETVSDVDSISVKIFAYTYDHTVGEVYNLTLYPNSGTFISNDIVSIDNDIVSIDIIDISAFKDGLSNLLRNNNLQVLPSNFVIRPLINTFNVNYTDKTNLSYNVTLPISDRDSLTVFSEFFKTYSVGKVDTTISLGMDTINFTRKRSTRTSKISFLENYDGQEEVYSAKLTTNFPSLENPSLQFIESTITKKPNLELRVQNFSASVQLSPEVELSIDLNETNIARKTLARFELSDSGPSSSPDLSLFGNQTIKIEYYNENSVISSTDTNFKLLIEKNVWRSLQLERIVSNFYNNELGAWVEQSARYEVLQDSTLVLYQKQGFVKNGYYNIVQKADNTPVKVNLSFDLNGNKADSVEYTSIRPNITINLVSQSINYILNPSNIDVLLVNNTTNDSIPAQFSFSYSGLNSQKLTLLVNSDVVSGNYSIVTKVNGFIDLRDKQNKKFSNNTAVQNLQVSGNDNLTYYGNYPNPFSDNTIFVYKLESSNSIDFLDVELKIYTISGHLIKTISNANVTNSKSYDENIILPGIPKTGRVGINYIRWDSRDDFGNEVANGVYFVKIVYKSPTSTFEKIIKVAKLKGIK